MGFCAVRVSLSNFSSHQEPSLRLGLGLVASLRNLLGATVEGRSSGTACTHWTSTRGKAWLMSLSPENPLGQQANGRVLMQTLEGVRTFQGARRNPDECG